LNYWCKLVYSSLILFIASTTTTFAQSITIGKNLNKERYYGESLPINNQLNELKENTRKNFLNNFRSNDKNLNHITTKKFNRKTTSEKFNRELEMRKDQYDALNFIRNGRKQLPDERQAQENRRMIRY